MAKSAAEPGSRGFAATRHPAYPVLLPIPIVCFVGALITDIVYSRTPDMMWLDFSSWLLLAGLIGGGFAGVALIVDIVRGQSRPLKVIAVPVLLLLGAWVAAVFNSFVHARDGWTAVVPTGMILSIAAAALSLLAGWFWKSARRQEEGAVL